METGPSRHWTIALAILLALTTLVVDLFTDLGAAAAVPYAGSVLLVSMTPSARHTLITAAVGTSLVVLGWAAFPEGWDVWDVIDHRGLALGAIWLTAVAGIRTQKGFARERQLRDDLTESERIRVEQETLAQLGEMAAVIAHEVKNPLTGISGALQIIRRRIPEDAREQQVIDDILARTSSLGDWVNDILFYARPHEPKLEEVCLRDLVDRNVKILSSDPKMREVAFESSGGGVLVKADPYLVGRAIYNLMLNAAQATDRKGHIHVSIARNPEARQVTLAVADDGPGIPLELQERVFEPFFTTRSRGSGLGLPSVRRTVQDHGGDVAVECPREGGTRVTITLPDLSTACECGCEADLIPVTGATTVKQEPWDSRRARAV